MGEFFHPAQWTLVVLVVASVLVTSSVVAWVRPQRQAKLEDSSQRLPKIFNYETYLEKYHKFPFFQRPLKFLNRARLFIGRTLEIFKHNARYASNGIDHYLRQNLFTDMTVREIVNHFVSRNSGLAPVKGAAANPNLSAEDYMAQVSSANQRRMSEEGASEETDSDEDDSKLVYDDFSQADLSDLPADDQQIEWSHSGGLDFLHEPQIKGVSEKDIKSIIKQIRLESDVARRVARRFASGSKTVESRRVRQQVHSTEKARKDHGILQAPFVEPNNKNFDPSLLMSQSMLGSVSEYLMGGYPGMNSELEAESDPDDAPSEDPEEAERLNKSLFVSLVDRLADYFTENDLLVENGEEEDDEEEEEEEEEFKDAHESFVNFNDLDEMETDEESTETFKGRNKIPGRIVYDIDWRQTGCISRPKHQINCNSCYAFATLDLMEFFHCRQKKTYTEFSAQYLIDCGHKTGLNGCRGGKLSNVGKFIQSHGIQLNAVYPYQGLDMQCPFDEISDREQRSFAMKPKITGWRMFDQIDAWYKWLPKTPLIVGINMPSDFLAYGGGVHDGRDCVQGMGHAMLLVGSGKQDGKPFWLLKNSFSEGWGEAGYFRLSKRAPLRCFNSVIVARANFNVLVQ